TVSGINPIARAFEFYFPIVIFIFFSVLFLGLQRFELDNLRPLFGQGFKPVLRGIMTTFLTYAGFETMMILTAFMKEPWKAVKVVVIGIGISIAFYVSLSVVVVGVLTVEEIKTLAWPTIALVNSIEYPGGFVENFQVFFLIVWIFAIYTTFVSSHYIACLGLGQISNKAFNSFVYALIPIIYIVALAPQNLEEVFQLGDYIGYFGVFMGGIVPVILLFIAIIRREGCAEKQGEK
ncbi:MAG TPA: endospore germination permease, partial [Clostridiales bacterium]|nr:endospore germination permease [Clostridiales bacterium]